MKMNRFEEPISRKCAASNKTDRLGKKNAPGGKVEKT
jgi:hypothetical protein